MTAPRSIGQLSDREVLPLFETGLDPATQGVGSHIQARGWATEMVRVRPDLATWTEAALLDQLVEERPLLDFFAGVLDELLPAAARV